MNRSSRVLLRTTAVLIFGLASVQALATDGPLSNATVSFGQWKSSPPVDRHPDVFNPAMQNRQMIPNRVTIRAGGSVNFIVSGFHGISVYGDGIKPSDINPAITVAPTNGGPPLIADPSFRIYRGLDPSLQPRDRVEVVHFADPGTYLVICSLVPHFLGGMYGWVRVLP